MLRSPKARDQFAKEQFYPMWEGPSKSDYILTLILLPVPTLPAGLLQAAASTASAIYCLCTICSLWHI